MIFLIFRCLLEYITLENILKNDLFKISELQNIFSLIIPFGKILENNFYQIKEILNKQKIVSQNETLIHNYLHNQDSAKIPQYKFFFCDGKQEMELCLEEEIISYQFCNEMVQNFQEIIGKITIL